MLQEKPLVGWAGFVYGRLQIVLWYNLPFQAFQGSGDGLLCSVSVVLSVS